MTADIKRITLIEGKELPRGSLSSTGAYAIIDRRKGKILRVALNPKIAEILAADYKTRKVTEVSIKLP
jgi:hypothetical protein